MSTRYTIIAFTAPAAKAVRKAINGASPEVKFAVNGKEASAWLWHADWAIDWQKVPSKAVATFCEDGEIESGTKMPNAVLEAILAEVELRWSIQHLRDAVAEYRKIVLEEYDASDDEAIHWHEDKLGSQYQWLQRIKHDALIFKGSALKQATSPKVPKIQKQALKEGIQELDKLLAEYALS